MTDREILLSLLTYEELIEALEEHFNAFVFIGEQVLNDDGHVTGNGCTYIARFKGSLAQCVGLATIVREKELQEGIRGWGQGNANDG